MQATPYELLGGEAVLRRLVDAFYDLMDSDPRFAGIRALHPPDLEGSRDKLFMFLSGWLGGPPLYMQRFGHPMLRARHLPFPIGSNERDQWIACMDQAMRTSAIEPALAARLMAALLQTASHLRNRADESIPGAGT